MDIEDLDKAFFVRLGLELKGFGCVHIVFVDRVEYYTVPDDLDEDENLQHHSDNSGEEEHEHSFSDGLVSKETQNNQCG